MAKIYLLGQCSVHVGSHRLPSLESRKALELLAYLIVHRGKALHRDGLAEVHWPECEPARARRYLRQSIWQLNQALCDLSEELGGPFIATHDKDWISCPPAPTLSVDLDMLEVVARRSIVPPDLTDVELNRAWESYNGPFVEGRSGPWIELERVRYQTLYFRAVDELIVREAAKGNFVKACEIGHSSLRFDSAHEVTHRILMQVLLDAGDHVAALRQYRRCADALWNELRAHPDEQTQALYYRIRDIGARPPLAASPDSVNLQGLSQQIRRLQNEIAELRSHFHN